MKLFKNLNIGVIVKVEIIILVILIVVDLYGFYLNFPGVKDAITLATTVKPETFTELYFENHLKLPLTVKIGEKHSFEFTVHNLEYKTYQYPYEVYIDTNGEKQYIEKGVFALKQDQFKTIKEDFSTNLATRSAIVVNLISKNQMIDFWVNNTEILPKVMSKLPRPTPLPKKYGGWYWNTQINKSQVWLGSKNGVDKWSDTFPVVKKK